MMNTGRYGIFDGATGKLDCDPEPMVFDTREDAVAFLNGCDEYAQGDYYVDSIDCLNEIETIKQIRRNNTALTVYLTKEVKQLGLHEGDWAKITIEKLNDAPKE